MEETHGTSLGRSETSCAVRAFAWWRIPPEQSRRGTKAAARGSEGFHRQQASRHPKLRSEAHTRPPRLEPHSESHAEHWGSHWHLFTTTKAARSLLYVLPDLASWHFSNAICVMHCNHPATSPKMPVGTCRGSRCLVAHILPAVQVRR